MGDPPPGLGRVDLQPDDGVAPERGADPLAEDAAAAERDGAAVGLLQQGTDDLGLARPEAVLAVALEGLGDRHPELALPSASSISVVSRPASRAAASAVLLPAPMKPMKTIAGLHRLSP